MRAIASEEQAGHRRVIARVVEHWAHGEDLVEGDFTVEDVAPGKPIPRFQVHRSNHMSGFHNIREVWRVSSQRFDDDIGKFTAAIVPIAGLQFVGSKLEIGGEYM